mmetsp:Transcript_32788/g.45536  ORF Transcript_32788/g.45536 Transcript_32788/m.45536 type:complete len:241 (-) Transcript_32788:179-901(-)
MRAGLEHDDPRRFRRKTPAQSPSLNSGRVADAMAASFGPGQPGCFGEGGSFQRISGPLSLPYSSQESGCLIVRGVEGDDELYAGQNSEEHRELEISNTEPSAVPISLRDNPDFASTVDQQYYAPSNIRPEMCSRDDFQDNYRTEVDLAEEDAEMDTLLSQFKERGKTCPKVKHPAVAMARKIESKAGHHVTSQELVQNYKIQSSQERNTQRRTMPIKSKAEQLHAAAESMAFYKKQFGLE